MAYNKKNRRAIEGWRSIINPEKSYNYHVLNTTSEGLANEDDLKDCHFDPKTKFLWNSDGYYLCWIDPQDSKRNFKQPSIFTNFEAEVHFYEQSNLLTDKQYYQYYQRNVATHYEKPSAAIDLIGLRAHKDAHKQIHLQILLTKRLHRPFKSHWALPGSFINSKEAINHACLRKVKEETSIGLNDQQIIRLPAVSKPGRDPRMWVITNPNIVLFTPKDLKQMHINDNDEWLDIKLIPDQSYQQKPDLFSYYQQDLMHFHIKLNKNLAFDHQQIIEKALRYLLKDFGWNRLPLISKLLGDTFTMNSLKALYSKLNPAFKKASNSNLVRKLNSDIKDTGKRQSTHEMSHNGRPQVIYSVRSQNGIN